MARLGIKHRERGHGSGWGLRADSHGTPLDRFYSLIDVGNSPAGCWIWQGSLTTHGYARMMYDRKELRCSRLIYEATVGKIPKGWHIDHLCRTPACVNPLHLEAVTIAENLRRGIGVGSDARKVGGARGS